MAERVYALLLTLFFFILGANLIGLIPVFDVLSLLQHTVIHAPEESFFAQVLHGGTTATRNFNVTAALATISFLAIIVAGARAHGFVQHWKNMVPHGAAAGHDHADPDRDHGDVRAAVRADDATRGQHDRRPHRILAILSFVFIFMQMNGYLGIGVGLFLSVPLAVGISGARDHRRARSGLRVHALDGRVHRHGHPRSSLSY